MRICTSSFGSAPTTTHNDCKSEGGTTAETCNIATAQAGKYYVLVHGYTTFSGHEPDRQLQHRRRWRSCGGTVLCSGTAVALPSVSTVACRRTTRWSCPRARRARSSRSPAVPADADLYVKLGSAPTTSSYCCRPYLTGNNETCTFNAPTAGTYYINVRAYSSYSGVSLKGTVSP
jgi:pseudolysin/vibriolysin